MSPLGTRFRYADGERSLTRPVVA